MFSMMQFPKGKIVAFRNIASVSSVTPVGICICEWLLMAIMAINGYCQKLNIFSKEIIIIFIIIFITFKNNDKI